MLRTNKCAYKHLQNRPLSSTLQPEILFIIILNNYLTPIEGVYSIKKVNKLLVQGDVILDSRSGFVYLLSNAFSRADLVCQGLRSCQRLLANLSPFSARGLTILAKMMVSSPLEFSRRDLA